MLGRFSDLPLRAKFVAVTMLVGTVSTVFVTVAFLLYANAETRSSMVRELSALAQVLAENSGAALVFNDPVAASTTLTALRVRPDVLGGRIVRPTGEAFARYGEMPTHAADGAAEVGDDAWIAGNHIWVTRPIVVDGDRVGSVEVAASLDVLRDERNAVLAIAGVIALLSTVIAFGLSTTLQRALVGPITHLAGVMQQVRAEKAYSRRAERKANDELGQLITGFNQMLEQIEAQHRELELYRKRLEGLVGERTIQLQEANTKLQMTVADLQVSKNELERTNRYKSEFLANMSHELRTPLNAIIGFSELMVEKVFGPLGDPHYEQYVRDISRSAEHLVGIIGDILDMTRMESGMLELEEEVVEVDGLIEDVMRIMAPLVRSKELRLDWSPQTPGLPMLRCDPQRVRQVLINLLSNATKFTEAGGTILIHVSVDDDLTIVISDTGIGIAEADLKRVMTPFAQVENSMSRKYQGTGLGLSLSKTLMEHHQGTLSLASRLGEGTSVTLRFPGARLVVAGTLQRTGGQD